MVHLIPADRFLDVICLLLVVKSCRMYSNDNDGLTMILILYPVQIGQGMHAVYAAMSLKIKYNYI